MSVFYLFIVLAVVTSFVLVPLAIRHREVLRLFLAPSSAELAYERELIAQQQAEQAINRLLRDGRRDLIEQFLWSDPRR